MSATVYVTEDKIAIAWGSRGSLITVCHDGDVIRGGFTPPLGSIELQADADALDAQERDALEGAVRRLRACPVGKRLAEKTLDALAEAIADPDGARS